MSRVEEFNKEDVLRGAMRLFWEKGYNGTSMQDLVNVTRLNRSSIYNSFGSKMELYQACLKYYQKKGNTHFQRALLKSDNSLEAIRLIFESFLPEIMGDTKGMGCFVLNCKAEMGNSDENIKEWLLNTQEHNLSVFQDLIKDGQEQGLINTDQDYKTYAYYVYSAFQGFRMSGILIKDRKVLQEIIDSSIRILT